MSIQAMKQAMEALEFANVNHWWGSSNIEKAITSLRQAIEQAEKQEPVAVARVDDLERGGRVRALAMGLALDAPLYTTPPAAPVQDPVAGIQALRDVIRCLRETGRYTDDEGEATDALDELAQKLTTPPAAPVQEPVAWAWRISPNADQWQFSDEPHPEATRKRPLVFGDTTPPAAPVQGYVTGLDVYLDPADMKPKRYPAAQRQWVSLTDEEIIEVARDHYNPYQRPEISFARAIEAKLREKNGGGA